LEPVSWYSFSIPKAGNKPSENEDAVFPASGHDCLNRKTDKAAFAVADGATQTSFSGLWANCLVKHCTDAHLSEFNFQNAVTRAQAEWQLALKDLDLPWHAQEKVRLGAFSALTWVEIQYDPLHPATAFTWRALAVGDCCLFIAHNHTIYLSLPLQDPSEFSNSPVLIPSKSEKMDSIKNKIQTARGSLMRGDQLILASDAISSWIMRKPQKDQREYLDMVNTLRTSGDELAFTTWVNRLRRNGELRNDDTSIVYIELGEGG
jgi:hypothetical protein